MGIDSIVKLMDKELLVFGVSKGDVPTLMLGLLVMSWSAISIFTYRTKIKCNDVSCKKVSAAMLKIDSFDEKLGTMLRLVEEINDKSSQKQMEEVIELRHAIDSMHNEISRLSGVIAGNSASQKTRKVIKHESY